MLSFLCRVQRSNDRLNFVLLVQVSGSKGEDSLDQVLRKLQQQMTRKGILSLLHASFLPGQRCIPPLSEAQLSDAAAAAAGGLGSSSSSVAAKTLVDLSSVFVAELPRAAKVMLVAGGSQAVFSLSLALFCKILYKDIPVSAVFQAKLSQNAPNFKPKF